MMSWILKENPDQYMIYGTATTDLAKDAMWSLVLIYGISVFQIIVGLVGIILSSNSKKAIVCQIL